MWLYIIEATLVALITGFIVYQRLKPKINQTVNLNAETANKNKELQQQQEELIQKTQKLKEEVSSLTVKKETTIEQVSELTEKIQEAQQTAQQTAETYYSSQLENAKQRLSQQLILEEQKYNIALCQCEEDFQARQDKITAEVADLEAKLAVIKSKYDAVIEESKRREEMANKIDYYRIIIPKEDMDEINALMSIEHLLSNKRNLYMLIWSSYYSKRVNELAVRVLGNKPIMGIYRLTNIETQQMYIGQSRDVRERFREHVKCALSIDTPGNNKLYPNMIKYRPENFTFELLETCNDSTQLNEKERYWIEFYDTYNNGLNNTRGNK